MDFLNNRCHFYIFRWLFEVFVRRGGGDGSLINESINFESEEVKFEGMVG